MTSTLSRITIVFVSLLLLHAPMSAQDGIAWLPPASPYNVRSGAFLLLHGGESTSGTSFGFFNTVSIPVLSPASIEGSLLLSARNASSGSDLTLHSVLAAGLRVDCAVTEEYILPLQAGLASVTASRSAAQGIDRATQLYAGLRPDLHILQNFELVGAAGMIWDIHTRNIRPYCTVGIRAGSVFTLSLDLAGIFDNGAGTEFHPPLLR